MQSWTWPSPNGASGSFRDVAAGQIGADRFEDLAFVDQASNQLFVARGKGDGTFEVDPTLYSTAGPSDGGDDGPKAVLVADLNGDGLGDVAIANQGPGGKGGDSVEIWLATDAGLGSPTFFDTLVQEPYAISAGDLNGDGIPDLVVVDEVSSPSVAILYSGPSGFSPQPFTPTGGAAVWSCVGDVDGDGHPDLILSELSGGGVQVYLNPDGTGPSTTPAASVKVSSGTAPYIALGDFGGTGYPDIAAIAVLSKVLWTLINGTAEEGMFGGFEATVLTTIPGTPSSGPFAVGDFDGDGVPDLAILYTSGQWGRWTNDCLH